MSDPEKALKDALALVADEAKKAVENAVHDIYIEYLPWVCDDTANNVRLQAEAALSDWLVGRESRVNFTGCNRADVLRTLYDANKDRIENEMIESMAYEIESLKLALAAARDRRY